MNLAGYTIKEIIYAVDGTVVARAVAADGAPVALKYQDDDRPSPGLLARWKHEFAVLRSIDSPWVVKAHALQPVDHRLLLVLEDAASTNLAQLLVRQPLDLGERLTIAVQLAQALGDVHAHGLIHGDVSPKNVLVDVASMRIKLCDFGLSSRLDHEQKRCDDAFLRGTLEYMSPEQTGRTNLDVDYRSDLYSLGASLYELFAGRTPFASSDPMTLLHAQIAVMPTPLHELDASIPATLSALVQKLLAKYPGDRYQSSFGLHEDLQRCLQQVQQHGRIDDFALATADVPERFCVAQKLYGREPERALILSAFERVGDGHAELLLVSGYSGIGKTAVVSELHRPIVARRGYFLRGKCDQYSRNQPYSALIQAFQQLLRQLAAEGEARRSYWRARLQEALGENAAAVAEIIPNLLPLIGTPPPLPPLPAAENEHRFHIAFARFVDALAAPGHPLLVFLDDLQWADAPTLLLIEHLVRSDGERCLLIVGAYRDNEVDASHPLHAAIAAIARAQGRLQQLQLSDLSGDDVRRLVADTLHADVDAIAPLAALCLQKTRGNPFFLGQLLRNLHEDGGIRYDRERGVWRWDIEQIRLRGISDNVVDLLLHKVRALDRNTQALLALAAQLGDSFDLRQLCAVGGDSAAATASALWPALQAGLILPLDENYKFDASPERLQAARYRFLHDRVQQAAWQLTPPDERLPLRLRCGRLLLADSSDEELDERLFIVLDALNAAIELITDPDERARLLALNLRGGMQAKAASAHAAAVSLLRHGKALLAADAWQTDPEQTVRLYAALAEAEYLAGNFADAERLYPEGIDACRDPIGKVTLCLVQVDQYHIQGRFAEAMPVLRHALALLGGEFPDNEDEAGRQFPDAFALTEQLLAALPPQQRLRAPEMTAPEHLLTMRIHNGLSFAAYQVGCFRAFVLNACRWVETTLRHGQCDMSCAAYAGYITAMSAMKRPYPDCYRMGRFALTLAEQRDNQYFRLTVYQYFSAFYQHWGESLAETYPYLARGIELGQSGINLLSAGYCALLRAVNRFSQGVPLEALQLECERGLAFLQQSHQPATAAMLQVGVQLPVMALRGLTLSPTSFDTVDCRSSDFFAGDLDTPSIPLAFHLTAMARHAYLFDDAAQWRQCAARLAMVGLCLPDSPSLVEASFYAALGMLRSDWSDDEIDTAAIEQHLQNFRLWAQDCPANFHHKALLIEAELACRRGDDHHAMDLYAQAIDAAAEADFVVCEALANERYALFWKARRQRQLARNFIREAHYHYRRWGAEAKCRQLEASWPGVPFRSAERHAAGSSQGRSFRTVSEQSGLLDLHSLLKANQVLAREIHLESLLRRMLGVLLENAGAEHGSLVLVDDDRLVVEVSGGIDAGRRFDCRLVGRPLAELSQCEQPLLPAAIIEYVQLTRATALLNNPAGDHRFSNSRYLRQRQPKSVLCLPVNAQGKLVALVYMENNLTEGAFTGAHQQTLELLAAQAAISLVNARLYESLEQKVQQRTEELRQMSMKDGLTGIANRRSFDERLAVELRRGQRNGAPLSLLMIDIDHFKQFNDHYGHFSGDDCIRAVATTLSGVVHRASDLLARYGGEEFAVLLPDTDAAAAARVAEGCLQAMVALAIPHALSPVSDRVSLSIGIGTFVVDAETTAETIITAADQALYQAKRGGRNRWCQSSVGSRAATA